MGIHMKLPLNRPRDIEIREDKFHCGETVGGHLSGLNHSLTVHRRGDIRGEIIQDFGVC